MDGAPWNFRAGLLADSKGFRQSIYQVGVWFGFQPWSREYSLVIRTVILLQTGHRHKDEADTAGEQRFQRNILESRP